jgi:hypothetical protein
MSHTAIFISQGVHGAAGRLPQNAVGLITVSDLVACLFGIFFGYSSFNEGSW